MKALDEKQQKWNEQENKLNSLKVHIHTKRGSWQWEAQDRIDYIKQQGVNLDAGSDDHGVQVNRQIIETLLDGMNQEQRGQIIKAALEVEMNKPGVVSDPNTFLRSESIFKLFAEEPMRQKLIDNPKLAEEYANDSNKFMRENPIPVEIREPFKEMYQRSKKYAEEKGKEFNKASKLHAMGFSGISGPVLKFLKERKDSPKFSQQERNQFAQQLEKASLISNMKQTDGNIVLSGMYKSKFHAMRTRRKEKLTKMDAEAKLKTLDTMGKDLGVTQKGELTNDGTYLGFIKDFGEKVEKAQVEEKQKEYESKSFLGKAWSDLGDFFSKVGKAVNEYFGGGDQEVTIKIDLPKSEPEVDKSDSNPLNIELDSSSNDPKVEQRSEQVVNLGNRGNEMVSESNALKEAKSALPETPKGDNVDRPTPGK